MGVDMYYVKAFCNNMANRAYKRKTENIHELYNIVLCNLRHDLNDGYIDIGAYRYYYEQAYNAYKEALDYAKKSAEI